MGKPTRITKTCQWCGEEFEIWAYLEKIRNHCSNEHRNKALRGRENQELHDKGLWQCKGCKQIKKTSEFHRDKHQWTGHCGWCKICKLKLAKEWRKKAYKKNPWKLKVRSINRKAGFILVTPEDMKTIFQRQKSKCYYCGKDLKGALKLNPRDIQLDHVINGEHRLNNLVISCQRCNILKSDATPEELERIALKMRQHSAKIA